MPNGKIETVLKSEGPWSPTGVAVRGQDVYVLEYANADEDHTQWLPRIRKLGHDGTITMVASVSREDR
jgi:hypothetical protein